MAANYPDTGPDGSDRESDGERSDNGDEKQMLKGHVDIHLVVNNPFYDPSGIPPLTPKTLLCSWFILSIIANYETCTYST
jgi:hypothetical protein